MAFRSPGSRTSPRVPKQTVAEGPIFDFTLVIEKTKPEDWKKRIAALQTLISEIPTEDNQGGDAGSDDPWYRSAPTLRHLAIPVSDLLTDARSTVVKRTCESMSELFSRCGSDARYLLKDLMPAVCQVHASTVQVIRNYVQELILETLPKVPCKMTMPVWLDRLKHDKSRTAREACSLYLASSMAIWGAARDDSFEHENSGYLTREIYLQVGSTLVRTLRDPSPLVRQNCKKGLSVLAAQNRDVLNELIADKSLTRDMRTIKLLQRLQAGEQGIGDDMSVSSRRSTRSRGGASVASAPVYRGGGSSSRSVRSTRRMGAPPRARRRSMGGGIGESGPVPTTIGVRSPRSGAGGSSSSGAMGPPRRVVNGASSSSSTRSMQTVAKPKPASLSPAIPTREPASPGGMALSTPTQKLLGTTAEAATPVTPLDHELEMTSSKNGDGTEEELVELLKHTTTAAPATPNKSFDSTETDVSVLRPIANAEELRLQAKSRTMLGAKTKSRRSSILLDRLLRSASKFDPDDANHQSTSTAGGGGTAGCDPERLAGSLMGLDVADLDEFGQMPFHTKIAYELVEAHKLHIDQVMETLKVEMDALKDFELVLLEQGPVRPTEEEVVEYFESLGLCLEQRKKAGAILQKKMDRISQG
ncbi:unnamed protein product [Pseudo-nitzschia multistriata]|uniref:CLASP N-terminal domain-containing protein n=1 Tax=Pseudo-nitzschia multistriata TaxID=183589 RepID=A0A448YYF2_9STRA|nr:unnamed protein product [Pseudo-nitzschia multistriata]